MRIDTRLWRRFADSGNFRLIHVDIAHFTTYNEGYEFARRFIAAFDGSIPAFHRWQAGQAR